MDGDKYNLLEQMLLDSNKEPTDLPLSLLKAITENFSEDRKIGRGGFADVYEGILHIGSVAVKRLFQAINLDENDFNKEVINLLRVKHQNVVRFLGYCADTQRKVEKYGGKIVMADVQQRLLCFEFLPNGSLDKHINNNNVASGGLEWRTYYQIIKGLCQGLDYLHQQNIVHLDLKPANILLDCNMVPKISDFGLSRCFDEKQTRAITAKVVGTLGYMAPEFISSGVITTKSDIYSLGIIIIEILTGQKGYLQTESVLESWSTRFQMSHGDLWLEHVRVCAKIGLECMDSDPVKRPTTRQIIERLDELECTYGFIETNNSAIPLSLSLSLSLSPSLPLWKCDRCAKRYAVHSDWKAHSKVCGTREYRCDCGTLFSRRVSFITHRVFCDALAEESARAVTAAAAVVAGQHQHHPGMLFSGAGAGAGGGDGLHLPPGMLADPSQTLGGGHGMSLQELCLKREHQQQFAPSSWLTAHHQQELELPGAGSSAALFGSARPLDQQDYMGSSTPESTAAGLSGFVGFSPSASGGAVASAHMSATALLQKEAQMGATLSRPSNQGQMASTHSSITTNAGTGAANVAAAVAASNVPGTGAGALGFGAPHQFGAEERTTTRADRDAGNEGLTRDFLGLRAFSHGDILSMAGFDPCMSSASSAAYEQGHHHQSSKQWHV